MVSHRSGETENTVIPDFVWLPVLTRSIWVHLHEASILLTSTTQRFDIYLRSNATLVSNDNIPRSVADSYEYPSPHVRPILNR
ncbi:hypothetical protein PIIN_09950 [Serendipita indica DSM 11827]|uniref:Uncharacterized protein n=1 Tax=Serendipita indica (strain DSM 11827) TaxID=1109443 RepID=G4TXB1_SERID|nr:hypothetical protein PIIN_09950 [Serendipita indica DSM 11827]